MIFIKPHRPKVRSHDNIPGLHIHNQGVPVPNSENDLILDPNDPDALEKYHYPKGKLYTPEIERWRESFRLYKKQHPNLTPVESAEQCEPAAPAPNGDANSNGELKASANKDSPVKILKYKVKKQWDECCASKQYPVDLDIEHEGTLFLKIMIFRSLQMLASFALAFYVQVTWNGMEAAVEKSVLVNFAFDFPWTLYLGIFLYAILHAFVHFTDIAKYRSIALTIYILKAGSIGICIFVVGVRWEFIGAPAIALTLAVHCLFLGFLPQFKEDIQLSKSGKIFLVILLLDVLLLSFGSWFALSRILSSYDALVSLTFLHEDIYSQLFLHCGATCVAAECIAILDFIEVERILSGRRFPLNRKSWIRASVAL